MRVTWNQKPSENPPSEHPFWEIVLVLQGHATHHIGKSSHRIQTRDLFVINDRNCHSYTKSRALRTVNLTFDYQKLKVKQWPTSTLRGFQKLFHPGTFHTQLAARQARLHLSEQHFRNLIALMQELDKTSRERFPCWQMMMDCHFRHLVLLLSRAYDGYLRTHDEALERMTEATSFLQEKFRQEVNLNQLAKDMGMSQRTFYRLFKRATRQSPLSYLIRLRIQYACDQLRNTDHPITPIAFDSGFSDSNYFAREFRKIIGESPTAYRGRWAD